MKSFEKKLDLFDMIMYVIRKWHWFILFSVITTVLAVGVLVVNSKLAVKDTNQALIQYELINGNYECSTLVTVIPEASSGVEVKTGTFLSAMLSENAITGMISELGLKENFIDIFNKIDWRIEGDTIKLTLISPINIIDGYTLEELLQNLISQGEAVIRKNYDINSFIIIDAPYYENPITINDKSADDSNSLFAAISMGKLVLIVMISVILSCAFLAMKYVLNPKITCPEDVVNNLEIPVLIEIKIS